MTSVTAAYFAFKERNPLLLLLFLVILISLERESASDFAAPSGRHGISFAVAALIGIAVFVIWALRVIGFNPTGWGFIGEVALITILSIFFVRRRGWW